MIRLKHVYKSYSLGETAVDVLRDINLHIRPKEFVSILGPSGSGKSTLMNIIGCLDVPDSGDYILDGEYVDHCTEDELSEIRGKRLGSSFSSLTCCLISPPMKMWKCLFFITSFLLLNAGKEWRGPWHRWALPTA